MGVYYRDSNGVETLTAGLAGSPSITSTARNRVKGKRMHVIGGSVAYNFCNNNSTATQTMKSLLELDSIVCHAVGGAGAAKGQGHDFQTQIDETLSSSISADKDFIVVWCSTNDIGNGQKIGTPYSYTEMDNYDTAALYSQCGGLNYINKKVKDKDSDIDIYLFTSAPFFNQGLAGYIPSVTYIDRNVGPDSAVNSKGKRAISYVLAQIATGEKNGWIIFDQFTKTFTKKDYENGLFSDGLHPTAAGYLKFVPKQVEVLATGISDIGTYDNNWQDTRPQNVIIPSKAECEEPYSNYYNPIVYPDGTSVNPKDFIQWGSVGTGLSTSDSTVDTWQVKNGVCYFNAYCIFNPITISGTDKPYYGCIQGVGPSYVNDAGGLSSALLNGGWSSGFPVAKVPAPARGFIQCNGVARGYINTTYRDTTTGKWTIDMPQSCYGYITNTYSNYDYENGVVSTNTGLKLNNEWSLLLLEGFTSVAHAVFGSGYRIEFAYPISPLCNPNDLVNNNT